MGSYAMSSPDLGGISNKNTVLDPLRLDYHIKEINDRNFRHNLRLKNRPFPVQRNHSVLVPWDAHFSGAKSLLVDLHSFKTKENL